MRIKKKKAMIYKLDLNRAVKDLFLKKKKVLRAQQRKFSSVHTSLPSCAVFRSDIQPMSATDF